MEEQAGPTVDLELAWQGEMRFTGQVGGHDFLLDGDGRAALSPVQALAAALAGCMATDIVLILARGRLPLRALSARLHAQRAAKDPRRLLRVELRFEVSGEVPADKVERAIALSRETYCSVWHSLRPDIELVVTQGAAGG